MKLRSLSTLLLILTGGLPAAAQTEPGRLAPLLAQPLQVPEVTTYELREYLSHKVPPLPAASTAEQWNAEAKRLRRQFLADVVFRGWPTEWVEAPLKVEDLGLIPSGKGYRMRKLRYEIVPGFWSAAILYEPETVSGKMPAILNVNGHVSPAWGKAVEYKQKRCINEALRGILALNLEWLSFGDLASPGNAHAYAAHLDLAGANGVGLFYLAMRKGLDYLYEHPNVDRSRIGVTGLSGGGWQTIFLSALDERVTVSIPVAGYSALPSRLERLADVGDNEQNPVDMYTILDYPHLTAMRAPRPTLLIYNAEDDCCFRAALVKPYIFDAVMPFYRLYGGNDRLAWHENTDPSTHNYQLDNRLAAYRYFASHFGLPAPETETPVEAEIKSPEELSVALPPGNLTILGLAKKLAARIERPSGAPDKSRLASIVRYRPTEVRHAWAAGNTKSKGLETRSYRFSFANGLSATGVWLKAITAADRAPATVVLNDQGKKASSKEVSDRVNRGEQVLAVDLLFIGDGVPAPHLHSYLPVVNAVGDRPLGIEAAQLAAIVRWLRQAAGAREVRLESVGMRSQVTSLVAAALEPDLFSEVRIRDGISSFTYLFEKPVEYATAPDLFSFELYKYLDLDRLAGMVSLAKVHQQ